MAPVVVVVFVVVAAAAVVVVVVVIILICVGQLRAIADLRAPGPSQPDIGNARDGILIGAHCADVKAVPRPADHRQ
jgi:hypothetical protein